MGRPDIRGGLFSAGGVRAQKSAPGEPDALRAGIQTLLGNRSLRERLAAQALAQGTSFDWNAIAQQHIEIYEVLLGPKGRV